MTEDMARILVTDKPDINEQGTMRWFIAELPGTHNRPEKLFLFQRQQSPRFMIGRYTEAGRTISEQIYTRFHSVKRFICRALNVDQIILSRDSDEADEILHQLE